MARLLIGWLALVLLAATPAQACTGKLLFRDDFKTVNPRWQVWEWAKIGGGAATITPETSRIAPILLLGDVYEKADICIDVIAPASDKPDGLLGGLIFAAKDYGEFHLYWGSPNGKVGVVHLSRKTWHHTVRARPVPSLRVAAGETNTLRLRLDGPRGTLFVNDTKVIDFRLNHLPGGGHVGLMGEGGGKWTFRNLRIGELEP